MQTAQLCWVAGRLTPSVGGLAQKYKWRPLACGLPLLSPPTREGLPCVDTQPVVPAPSLAQSQLPPGHCSGLGVHRLGDQTGRGTCRGPRSGFCALYSGPQAPRACSRWTHPLDRVVGLPDSSN